MFFSSSLIEYARPSTAPQSNNGNLYRQDHIVTTALGGDDNVTGWVMSANYYYYDSLNRAAIAAEDYYTSAGTETSLVATRTKADVQANRMTLASRSHE